MPIDLRRKARGGALVGAVAAALAFIPGALPADPQLLTLGPVTVLNGTAIVSGTVGGAQTGGQITLNGQPRCSSPSAASSAANRSRSPAAWPTRGSSPHSA